MITRTLGGKGLTGLELDPRAGTFQYSGWPRLVEIQLLEAGAESSPGFAEAIECQLNTPFVPKERFTPFRFIVAAERDAFSLGLVHFHPVAGAESIVFLLKDMVDTYRATDGPSVANPVEPHPARLDNLLLLHPFELRGGPPGPIADTRRIRATSSRPSPSALRR